MSSSEDDTDRRPSLNIESPFVKVGVIILKSKSADSVCRLTQNTDNASDYWNYGKAGPALEAVKVYICIIILLVLSYRTGFRIIQLVRSYPKLYTENNKYVQ